jgi:hypothetical protein
MTKREDVIEEALTDAPKSIKRTFNEIFAVH